MRESSAHPKAQLGELLLQAASLETARLDAFLEHLDAERPTLAPKVRRHLLAVNDPAADDVPDSFLALPAAARLAPPSAEDSPTVVEPAPGGEPSSFAMVSVSERYALGECLGQGGMARVFEAFDHKLARPLALKFLIHEDPELVRRFLEEARAQARVRHDSVLEIYDTGELEGRPFIAMRQVRGGTLQQIRHRTSLEQQVRLLIQAAEGLHAAHCEGLIHRDVKPSNILVEEMVDGELKAFVADFGIATDAEHRTDAGGLMGTPSYIAPELLTSSGGPVDRRSDVYSFGVTLYELFTGRRPFMADDPMNVLAQITRHQPPPPRQIAPSLPPDLEAIVLRCLEKDPAARYPSARAVADDLKRFLAGEVVEAHAASLAYRLARFALRHRLLVLVAGVAAVALVIASVVIALFAVKADRERTRADQRRQQAEQLIDFMVVELRQKLASVERLEILDEVDNAALEYFSFVPAAELSDEELAARSRTLYQIGEVRFQKGNLAGAVGPFEESLTLARNLSERHPQATDRLFDLGQSYFWVGYVRFRQSDLDGARPPFEAYLDISQRLTRIDPGNLDWRLELSYAYSNLGFVAKELGDLEDALNDFTKALEIDQELVRSTPQDAELRLALSGTHNTVGDVLQSLGRLEEARTHFAADVALDRALVQEEPQNHRFMASLGTSLEFLGSLLSTQGKFSSASHALAEAKAVSEQLVSRDPENATRQLELAWRQIELGKVALAEGDSGTATHLFETSLQLLEAGFERNLSNSRWRRFVAISHYYLGLVTCSDPPTARSHVRAARKILEDLHTKSPEDRKAQLWLGKTLLLAGRLPAEDSASEPAWISWSRALQLLAPLSVGVLDGRILAPWAEALLRLGRVDEAQAALRRLQDQGFQAPELHALDQSLGIP